MTGQGERDSYQGYRVRWPIDPADCWIPFTPEMQALIRAEITRTGVTPVSLLEHSPDLPNGLSARIVRGWVYGAVKHTSSVFWQFALSRLASLPDAPRPLPVQARKDRKTSRDHSAHLPISKADRAALHAHRKRTGVGGAVLLDGVKDKPRGLTAAVIGGWLSGKTRTADPAIIAYVLERYAGWPDKGGKRS